MPLDITLLEQLAEPIAGGRVYVGESAPTTLDQVFSRVVADGWSPRSPAYGAELDRCVQSMIRGTCVEPLCVDGDVVYIDRGGLPPLPGDLVAFTMSQRLADLQNASPPPGQPPTWAKGAPWIKLFVPYHGIEFLHERHGGSLTATLAACESSKDSPILHPVRNIRRNGRLLFTPDTHASQVGDNAATVTVINFTNGSGSGITGFTGLLNLGFVVNPSNSPGFDCTVSILATIQARQTVGTVGQVKVLVRFADDGVTYASSPQEIDIVSSSFQTYTLSWHFIHNGVNGGLGQASIWIDNTGPSTNSIDWQKATLEATYIIR
jgi:hypothetical protein